MKKTINYGLSIRKTILSFHVIKTHFFRKSSTKNKISFVFMEKIDVFMFLAFSLCHFILFIKA